jgi:predicted nucleotidyltransferase
MKRPENIPEGVWDGVIYRCTVGSTLHGLALEGTDDRDEAAISILPTEYMLGLRSQRRDTWVFRSAGKGERSRHGDLDLTVYGLTKFVRMLTVGNPSALLTMFAPPAHILYSRTFFGDAFLKLRSHVATKRAGPAFLGYFHNQLLRLKGEKGQKRVRREHLVGEHGYDTKYAMHVLRLGHQGIEFLDTGNISLPVPPKARHMLMNVRRGTYTLQEVLEAAEAVEEDLKQALTGSDLPGDPDPDYINSWLAMMHMEFWSKPWRCF